LKIVAIVVKHQTTNSMRQRISLIEAFIYVVAFGKLIALS